jgi:hypothetical protein
MAESPITSREKDFAAWPASETILKANTALVDSLGEVEEILHEATAIAHVKDDPACHARQKEFRRRCGTIHWWMSIDGREMQS